MCVWFCLWLELCKPFASHQTEICPMTIESTILTCPPCEAAKSGRHLHKSVIGPAGMASNVAPAVAQRAELAGRNAVPLTGLWVLTHTPTGLCFKLLQSLHHVGQGFAQAPPPTSRRMSGNSASTFDIAYPASGHISPDNT